MSLEASLRFEADKSQNPNLRKAFEAQVERIKYDEVMADRENVVRLHKYHDFWDTLVKDVDHIVKKAQGIEEEKDFEESELQVNQRAGWNENLEESSWKKRIRNDHGLVKSEMKMASKAALSVRRVALKQLLEKEFEIWEKELALQGKTFYKQRI